MPGLNRFASIPKDTSFGIIMPVFLIIIATLVKGYAFVSAGIRIPILLYSIAILVCAFYGGKRSGIIALASAVVASIFIYLYPGVYDLIPHNPFSLPVLYLLSSVLLMMLLHSYTQLLSVKKEGNNYFKFLADSVPNMVYTANANGKATYYNKEWYQFTGFDSFEDIKANIWKIIHPDDLEEVTELYQKNIIAGRGYELEHRLKGPDGRYRWHISRVKPMVDNHGLISFWIGSCTDIHYQKLIEEEIRESEKHFRFLADNAPLIIWEASAAGEMTYLSKQWENLCGMSVTESLGKEWHSAIHPDDLTTHVKEFESSRFKKEPYQGKIRLKCEGEYRWFLCIGQPLLRPEVEGYIGTMTDITAEEILLQQSRMQLDKMDEFISIAGHELKTPVTTIRGYVDILDKKMRASGDTLYSDFVNRAKRQVLKLSSLIQDLLDVSKTREGKIVYSFIAFNAKDLIEDAIDAAKSNYAAHKIVVTGNPDFTITGDKFRIEQVICNLLSNAAKYSPEGSEIILDVMMDQEEFIVSIKDCGIGIPENKHEFIFNRFYRVDDASYKYPGLGIGLYICSEIVRRHNGKIWFTSAPDEGSVFSFSIPARIEESIDM